MGSTRLDGNPARGGGGVGGGQQGQGREGWTLISVSCADTQVETLHGQDARPG